MIFLVVFFVGLQKSGPGYRIETRSKNPGHFFAFGKTAPRALSAGFPRRPLWLDPAVLAVLLQKSALPGTRGKGMTSRIFVMPVM